VGINEPAALGFDWDFVTLLEISVLSITSSSSSEMSFNFFLAVEALEGVDLEEDFVVFDLEGALELGGSFCAVGFFMGLVLCSMLEGPVSCGQKQKSRRKFLKPHRSNLPAVGSSSPCVDFRPGFLGLLRRVALECSS
jgi:hypothetical protein